MSRITKRSIFLPSGVDIKIEGGSIFISGKTGKQVFLIHKEVRVKKIDRKIMVSVKNPSTRSNMQVGTVHSIINSMIIGVTKGFKKKLKLVGVGYSVSVHRNTVNLNLGFSHSISYKLPDGIQATCPSSNEIVLVGSNKQLLGQVAANLRSYKKPDPYKGKGIRYLDEVIFIKEAKKK